MDQKTIFRAVQSAETSFWNEIANQFPEYKTGDIEPLAARKLEEAMTEAVEGWLEINEPHAKVRNWMNEKFPTRSPTLLWAIDGPDDSTTLEVQFWKASGGDKVHLYLVNLFKDGFDVYEQMP